ncbi:MAG: MlaD family protein [Phycisphaerae bacterium]|nr:MlaD family protein [Phycisphaerae bacterium]MDW8262499.1 MlaD family protein [Phycisphaerales bacterium]
MSPYRRNVIVGLTVLIAMVILAWMILKFGGTIISPFTPREFAIRIISDRADGISDGSPVVYRGVSVGRVAAVNRSDDMRTIFIDAMIRAAPPLPGNLQAAIRTQGLIGTGASLDLELLDGHTEPTGQLQPGAQLRARYAGLAILPPELTELASELQLAARQFRESNVVGNLNDQVSKAGRVLDSAQSLLNDEAIREDLRQSLANLREVTEKANRVADSLNDLATEARGALADARGTVTKTEGHIDRLASQLEDRIGQLHTLLDRFNSVAAKLDEGQGTAGRLVNDPRLFESLSASAAELSLAIKDVRRVVQQIEQEGFVLRLR